jgi:hypothetical protein
MVGCPLWRLRGAKATLTQEPKKGTYRNEDMVMGCTKVIKKDSLNGGK